MLRGARRRRRPCLAAAARDDRPADRPAARVTADAPLRARPTSYPAPFAGRVAGRRKQPLGALFGLTNVGVNRTVPEPGAGSALRHRQAAHDAFVFVLDGTPTLVTDTGETLLAPRLCAGFWTGGEAPMPVDRSDRDVACLEIGDRTTGDSVAYPDDDLAAKRGPDGTWRFAHKDGTPY